MKAKNIKVGEWVFCKADKTLRRVVDVKTRLNGEVNISFARASESLFRKPTIADLKKGDVFEYGRRRRLITEPRAGARRIQAQAFEYPFSLLSFEPSTKVKIISLDSEKVGPERKTATVKRWHIVYPSGGVSAGYPSKKQAGDEAKQHTCGSNIVGVEWELPE